MDQFPTEQVTVELNIWDETQPGSLLSMVPESTAKKFREAMEKAPEFFGLTEQELKKKLAAEVQFDGRTSQKPTATDTRIRLRFWEEYSRAQVNNLSRMAMGNVYGSLFSRQYWSETYLANPAKVAWLLTPLPGNDVVAKDLLAFGLDELREILEFPVMMNGKFNDKLAALKVKIVEMAHVWVHGSAVQKTVSLNVNTGDKAVAKAVMGLNMEEVNQRLKEVEEKYGKISGQVKVVDAEVVK